jgi:hypothetical protein
VFLLVGAVVVVGGALSARAIAISPKSSPRPTLSDSSLPANFFVGLASCTFVDQSRFIENYVTGVITRGRTLVTEIYYPTLSPGRAETDSVGANPARRHGPYPMIVFSHGYDLTPASYAPLLNAWVKAGFVVVAPIFPDTNAVVVTADHDSSLWESDDVNQPLDVAFVTERIEANDAGTASGCPVVRGLINDSEIGLAGQSDGGMTTGMLAYDDTPGFSTTKVHYEAAAILSGAEWPWPKGTPDPYSSEANSPPLLVVQSATDECNPPQSATQLYNDIHQQKKWFLEIFEANHLPPYVGTDPAAFNVVVKVTTDFFNLTLRGDDPPGGLLGAGNGAPSVARFLSGERAPAIVPLIDDPASCYLGE